MHAQILETFFDNVLRDIDAAAGKKDADIYQVFNQLYDDDLWNILLLRNYTKYQNILNLLPEWPSPELQRSWVGNHGFDLSHQTLSFYKKAKEYYRIFGRRQVAEANILDFGCGWGRILRYFAKDVPNNQLFGCDPDSEIFELCCKLRVRGILRRSEFRPKSLPFSEKFDLVYAFSVFTHLSEATQMECLEAIHEGMHPGGLLVVTIRPRSFIDVLGNELKNANKKVIEQLYRAYDFGEYTFFPHNRAPIGGDITYGDTCIPLGYIQKKWTKLFKVTGIGMYCADMNQIPVLLQRN